MDNNAPYQVLAYYHFTPIGDPQQEVLHHKQFFQGKDVACRIYISEQGINGQMSADTKTAYAYIDWLKAKPGFENVSFKLDPYHELAFPKVTVKYKKHLVAYDEEIDLSKGGAHLSPEEWKKMLEEENNKILLDVRNDYEWQVGHFEGAELPPCATFRAFKEYADNLSTTVDPKKTPVMMYCTGGIRCELYSAVLKEKGFDKVYQLNGGIINYGHKEGGSHWLGKLFVFDDRLTVPVGEQKSVIGTCHHCGTSNDNYYNCANMDCNHLFLCCPECLKKHQGCCKPECQNGVRVRPYQEQNAHKPFRKWYNYFEGKKTSN